MLTCKRCQRQRNAKVRSGKDSFIGRIFSVQSANHSILYLSKGTTGIVSVVSGLLPMLRVSIYCSRIGSSISVQLLESRSVKLLFNTFVFVPNFYCWFLNFGYFMQWSDLARYRNSAYLFVCIYAPVVDAVMFSICPDVPVARANMGSLFSLRTNTERMLMNLRGGNHWHRQMT